jgi:Transcriptional activator of glycolytic enzymes
MPSLTELDRRCGLKWRYSMTLKTWYFNRKRLVEYVREKAKEREEGL